jgi:glycosyltransferase involved in cell wall biosynthesis
MPEVSVIIPTHNRQRLVSRAIRSVLSQTYTDVECIVVDDASTDSTPQVTKSIKDDRLVILRHESNRGASAARNTGMRAARGPLIAFLDDDDEWLPEKLAKQVPLLKALPEEYGMVYCWMDYFDDTGRIVHERHPTYRGDVFASVLVKQGIAGCPTLLLRRHAVEEVGGFDERLPRGNDGDFIRRVCRVYKVDVIPEVLVRVHVAHGYERITSQTDRGIRNHLLAQQAKLDKFPEELCKYPHLKATVLANIGGCHLRLGEFKAGLSNLTRSFVLSPLNPKLYRAVLSGIKGFAMRLAGSWTH